MKKVLLFLIGSMMILASVAAQENNEESSKEKKEASANDDAKRKNFFVGIGVKGNIYLNNDTGNDTKLWGKPTAGGRVFVGKWFNPYIAGRIVADVGKMKPSFQRRTILVDSNYGLVRLDVMFDVTNCFRSYSPDNFYNLIPYAGIGRAKAFNAKNRPDKLDGSSSFVYGGGLLNTFKLTERFSAFLNVGIDLVDAKFDGHKDRKYNGIVAGTVGMVVNF